MCARSGWETSANTAASLRRGPVETLQRHAADSSECNQPHEPGDVWVPAEAKVCKDQLGTGGKYQLDYIKLSKKCSRTKMWQVASRTGDIQTKAVDSHVALRQRVQILSPHPVAYINETSFCAQKQENLSQCPPKVCCTKRDVALR